MGNRTSVALGHLAQPVPLKSSTTCPTVGRAAEHPARCQPRGVRRPLEHDFIPLRTMLCAMRAGHTDLVSNGLVRYTDHTVF